MSKGLRGGGGGGWVDDDGRDGKGALPKSDVVWDTRVFVLKDEFSDMLGWYPLDGPGYRPYGC